MWTMYDGWSVIKLPIQAVPSLIQQCKKVHLVQTKSQEVERYARKICLKIRRHHWNWTSDQTKHLVVNSFYHLEKNVNKKPPPTSTFCWEVCIKQHVPEQQASFHISHSGHNFFFFFFFKSNIHLAVLSIYEVNRWSTQYFCVNL